MYIFVFMNSRSYIQIIVMHTHPFKTSRNQNKWTKESMTETDTDKNCVYMVKLHFVCINY